MISFQFISEFLLMKITGYFKILIVLKENSLFFNSSMSKVFHLLLVIKFVWPSSCVVQNIWMMSLALHLHWCHLHVCTAKCQLAKMACRMMWLLGDNWDAHDTEAWKRKCFICWISLISKWMNYFLVGSEQEPQIVNSFPKAFPSSPQVGDNVRVECIAYGTYVSVLYFHFMFWLLHLICHSQGSLSGSLSIW